MKRVLTKIKSGFDSSKTSSCERHQSLIFYAGLFLLTTFYVVSQAVDVYVFRFVVDIYLARIAMAIMAIGLALMLGRELLSHVGRFRNLIALIAAWCIYLLINSLLSANPTESLKLYVRFVGAWVIAFEIGILIYTKGEKCKYVIGFALIFTLLLILFTMHLESARSPIFHWLSTGLRNHLSSFRAQALYVNPNTLGIVLVLHAAAAIWYTLHPSRSLIIIPLVWFSAFLGILQSGSANASIGFAWVGTAVLFAYYKSSGELPPRHRRWLKIAFPVLLGVAISCLGLLLKSKFDRIPDFRLEYRTSWGWSTPDDSLPGEATRGYDDELRSNVIQLLQLERPRHFIYEFPAMDIDKNLQQQTIRWRMNCSQPFIISVIVKTTNGQDELLYTPDNMFIDTIYQSGLAFELGPHIADGKWHTVTRDLHADLQKGTPGAQILGVSALVVTGTGKFDDITVGNLFHEGFESETKPNKRTSPGWSMPDDSLPGEATRVYDDELGSNVMQLSRLEPPRHFIYEFPAMDVDKNLQQQTIRWRMNCSQPFVISVIVKTTKGQNELLYTPDNMFTDTIYQSGLAFELGSHIADGKWHTVTRDLRADLQKGTPGAEILGVSALVVTGAGKFDDIELGTGFHEGFEIRMKDNLRNIVLTLSHIDKGRIEIWERAFNYWKTKPFAGIGFGSFKYMPGEGDYHAHNFLFSLLVEQGMVGIAFLLAFLWVLIRSMKGWTGVLLLGSVLFAQLFDDLSPIVAFPVYASLILGYCFYEVLQDGGTGARDRETRGWGDGVKGRQEETGTR